MSTILEKEAAIQKEIDRLIENKNRLIEAQKSINSLLDAVVNYKKTILNRVDKTDTVGVSDWEGETIATFHQKFCEVYGAIDKVVKTHETMSAEIQDEIKKVESKISNKMFDLAKLHKYIPILNPAEEEPKMYWTTVGNDVKLK